MAKLVQRSGGDRCWWLERVAPKKHGMLRREGSKRFDVMSTEGREIRRNSSLKKETLLMGKHAMYRVQ